MAGDPLQQRPTSATGLADAVDAQIREAHEVLRADAAAAGVEPALVDAAVKTATDAYVDARVHTFIGILVERDVRSALGLRRAGTDLA